MKNRKVIILFIVLLVYCFIVGVNFSLAATTTSGLVPDGEKKATGNYSLNDIVGILPIAANWMLGIVGSLALLMFVYGGIMFLISAGSSEKVTQAKQVIVSAVIGLVIVFVSYMIIGFVFSAFNIDLGTSTWSNTGWF